MVLRVWGLRFRVWWGSEVWVYGSGLNLELPWTDSGLYLRYCKKTKPSFPDFALVLMQAKVMMSKNARLFFFGGGSQHDARIHVGCGVWGRGCRI